VQLYRYFVSQSSEFCRHNPLYCFLTSVCCCCCWFRYRLSPDTFGYTLVYAVGHGLLIVRSFHIFRARATSFVWPSFRSEAWRVEWLIRQSSANKFVLSTRLYKSRKVKNKRNEWMKDEWMLGELVRECGGTRSCASAVLFWTASWNLSRIVHRVLFCKTNYYETSLCYRDSHVFCRGRSSPVT
jgi:hypothetical protein